MLRRCLSQGQSIWRRVLVSWISKRKSDSIVRMKNQKREERESHPGGSGILQIKREEAKMVLEKGAKGGLDRIIRTGD